MFSEVAEIALVAARLGQFQQLLKTRVILILNLLGPMRLPIRSDRQKINCFKETAYFFQISTYVIILKQLFTSGSANIGE